MTDQQHTALLLAIYSSHILGRGFNIAITLIYLVIYAVLVWKG